MLWTICAVLLALWLVSMLTSWMMGGLAHLFLVAALAVILVRAWRGRSHV
jgi:hypothetical protein